ncbi:MAG: hypothetical protein Q8R28_20515, partial [Dehalococcoidia bacterium]|nr:hypothetical protein [Dehalococcoidia bacterium]
SGIDQVISPSWLPPQRGPPSELLTVDSADVCYLLVRFNDTDWILHIADTRTDVIRQMLESSLSSG